MRLYAIEVSTYCSLSSLSSFFLVFGVFNFNYLTHIRGPCVAVCRGRRHGARTGVDISTPVYVPEIDTNPVSFYGREVGHIWSLTCQFAKYEE